MVHAQLQRNGRRPHSAPLDQLHQRNGRPAMRLCNVLLLQVTHLRDLAHGRPSRHLAHIAQVDKGMLLQLALAHALARKCAGSLNDAPPSSKKNQQAQSRFHLKLS